jgi:hypothetical protein
MFKKIITGGSHDSNKNPKIPIRLPNQFNATQKVNTPILTSPRVVPVISDAAPTEATSSNATATSSQLLPQK